jgi:tetratricopeptide (TPR) repeat protein
MLGLVDAGNRRLVWSNTVEQPDDDTNRKFSGRPDFDPSEVRREVRSFARSFFREVRAPLKLSPDAKRLLALNCFDWRLVDIETGTALWMRPNVVMTLSRAGLSFRAITAAFSPDSQLLAVGDSRGALRIFETQSGREVRVLWGATEELGAAVFDPGGTRLAAVDIQGSLFVWEPSRGDLLLTLANAAAPGDGEAYFSPDGRRLVLGGASPAILESQFNPEARSRRAEIVRCYNRVFPLLDKLFCELPHRHAVMDRLRADVTLPDDVRRDAITLAERYVRVLGPFRPGQTPQTSQDNARLLFDAGWRVEAIRLLEDATRAADGLRTFQLQLEEYRRALEPDLVSYASIDAAVLLSDRSESFDAFRGVATGADAVSRLLYLEGRLLQRSGKSREALDRYRAAFDADRRGIDILERLAECAMACLEPIEAERIVVETFRSAEVFEMARPLRPSGRPVGSAAADQVLVLHASPFLYSHVDTSIDGLESQLEIPVLRSRWQVREAGGSFDAPALNLDVAPPLGPNRLALPAGILEPSKSYFWRIAYGGKALDSDGREVAWVESAFSFEVPLSTSGIPSSATESFDLQANFNRDVVADHGDSENDAFGLRGLLSLNGFAVPGSVREVYGLPSDRRVGVHLLADYAGKNAIEFTPDGRKPLRFTFPRGRFGAVRLLFSAVDDGADLVLRCDYAGEWRQLPLSLRYDEFDPTTPRDLRGHWKDRAPWVADESILVRHRACSHLLQPDGSFLPRPVWFFDAIVSTRQDRELSAIEVEAQYFARPESRVYLFAAAGMRIAE